MAVVDIEDSSCLIFTDSVERATTIVEEYERQTCSRFISASCSKDFGKSVVSLSIDAKRIYWNKSYKDEPASTPYIIVGQKQLDCHHGKDPDKAKKAKYRAEKEKREKPVSYLRVTPSKKVDCPARIILRDVVYFNDFKIAQDTKHHRQIKSRKLKTDFKSNKSGKITRHILVNLPATNEHRNHPSGEEDGVSQRVDPNVSKKIDELLAEGVNSVTEIQEHLESYVTTEQFPGQSIPSPSNRRYFPSKKTIRAKIYQFAIQQKTLSVVEQDSNARISEEESENYLRARSEIASTVEQATAIVKEYEERTFSKFISLFCPKDFGKSDAALNLEAKKVYWDQSYTKEETGSTPYIIVSQKQLECQYGKDRDEAKKAKRKAENEMREDFVARVHGRTSKKVDCPAKIIIRDLVYFTDFKIKDDTKYHREKMSKELKVAFKNKDTLRISRHFFINLPSTKDHQNHESGQVTSPPQKRKRIRKRKQKVSTAKKLKC